MNGTKTATAALVCGLALLGTTACGSDGDGDQKGGSSSDQGGGDAKGNGVEKLSAKKIASKADKALNDAGSVRVRGSGGDAANGAAKFDARMTKKGNCVATADQGKKGGYEVIKIGSKVWVKPDDTYRSEIAKQVHTTVPSGAYLQGDQRNVLTGAMGAICGKGMLQSAAVAKKNHPSKGEPGDTDGKPTVPVQYSNKKEKTTLHVATTGPAYPLRADVQGGKGQTAHITYSDFGKTVQVSKPSGKIIKAPDPTKNMKG